MPDIDQIKASLIELRLACACPRLYVANFFSDFLFTIDLACQEFLAEPLTNQKSTVTSTTTDALNCQALMAKKLKKIENECLDYLDVNEPCQIDQVLREVDKIESYLEINMDEKCLNELNDLVYDAVKTFQKTVLLNRSILFLTGESSVVKSLNNLDVPILFGMLVIVGDEFIDHKALIKDNTIGRFDHEDLKVHLMKEQIQYKLNERLIEQPIVTVFLRLNKKEFCYLANLRLTELHPNVFKGMKNLIKIHLGRNCLERLDAGTFKGLAKLEHVNLEFNSLTKLDLELFKDLGNLNGLNLRLNNFKVFDLGVFSGLKNLKEINLIGNKLVEIQGLNKFNRNKNFRLLV